MPKQISTKMGFRLIRYAKVFVLLFRKYLRMRGVL